MYYCYCILQTFHFRNILQTNICRMDVAPTKRHEKSLGLLTVKFVKLLKEAKDGILDLKEV